jgi:outer membrane protein assembly factor BamA
MRRSFLRLPLTGVGPCRIRVRAAAVRLARTLIAWTAAAGSIMSCTSLPPGRAAVDAIEIRGNHQVSERRIRQKLATLETGKLAGLLQGVHSDYSVFDRFVVQRDLARIERFYRSLGFYQARVVNARAVFDDPDHVRILIDVHEGPPTQVGRVVVRGLHGLSPAARREALLAVDGAIETGQRFEASKLIRGEQELTRTLRNRGYAYARVRRNARVDVPNGIATVTYDAVLGERARFGAVTIQGLGPIPGTPVRTAIDVHPGEAYSQSALEEAQQAALDLGVFSSVALEPRLEQPPPVSHRVPVHVVVRPSKLRSVELGGGLQLDSIRTDAHAVIGWDDRNFLGGLRRLTIELRPGVVLYPTRLPGLQAPTRYLPEERASVDLSQPGLLERRTRSFVRLEANAYPLLLSPTVQSGGPVLGYVEGVGSVGAERRLGRLFARPSYNVQTNRPFTYAGQKDPALGNVLVSYFELFASYDTRGNTEEQRGGVLLSNDAQLSGLGGDARDVRVQPELNLYVPLPGAMTLATRGTLGLLFAQNYASADGEPRTGTRRATWIRDIQLGLLRAFYSGGPNSNRGYPPRGIGPHGVVPFLSPEVAMGQFASVCTPGSAGYDSSRCALPLGGFTLWEASLELRFEIEEPFEGAAFCDTSDVAPRSLEFHFDRPHLSCGFGLRYGTPVGPVRLDVGYRVPGLQVPPGQQVEGSPPTLFGLPIALAAGIGEAF